MSIHTRPLRAVLTVVAAALALVGCGIRSDSAPRDVPPEQRNLLLDQRDPPSGASGTSRIYLVTPGDTGDQRLLRSVQRDVAEQPRDLLEALFAGPNDAEAEARLTSAIPPNTELLEARQVGDQLFVDVSSELTQLSGDGLVLAVAQIVFTANEIDGVGAVRLRVEGVDQVWPLVGGETKSGPLTVYDFPGLAESSQPAYPAIPSPAPDTTPSTTPATTTTATPTTTRPASTTPPSVPATTPATTTG